MHPRNRLLPVQTSPARPTGSPRARSGWRVAGFVVSFVALLLLLASLGRVLLPSAWLEAGFLWWSVGLGLTAALGATWLMLRGVERMPLAAVGLPWDRTSLAEAAGGALFGAIVIGAVVVVLAAAGWAEWSLGAGSAVQRSAAALSLTAFLGGAALAEELLFRGYPFQTLCEGAGPAVALAITSLVFGLLHAGNPFAAPLPLVNIALAGVLLGIAYWKTWSLWFATGVHFGWNWTMAVPAGLPVSGLGLTGGGPEGSLRGPEIWTGGAFGPEGGLVTTGVTLLAIAWLWRTERVGPALRVLALRPPATRRAGAVAPPGQGA